MSSDYPSWKGPARTLALAVDAAVCAADDADPAAFDAALEDLHRVDREQLLVLLGTAAQLLLERAAPDGLDAEEAERILRGTLTAAAAWYERVDGDALLRSFTALVGLADADEDPDGPAPPSADAVLAHGVLLLAHLRAVTRSSTPEVVDHALSELHRAQTVELP